MVEAGLWRVAERVCTTAELEALRTREALWRLGAPAGYRSVARALGISPTTARDHIESAERKLGRVLTEEHG